MEYLKIFTDFAKTISPLSDAECGRLFRAMLEYASSGAIPEFSGNERFIWPTAQLNIDREAAFLLKQHENGAKGGRPKNPTKPTETQLNPTEPNETQKTHKDKDKDKDKDNLLKEKKEIKEKKENPVRHHYGEYKNVFLTDDEYEKIKQEFPDYHERIERVSEYVAKTGKTYKNFLAVIRSWARNDAVQQDKKPSKAVQTDFNEQRRDDWLKRYIHGRGD